MVSVPSPLSVTFVIPTPVGPVAPIGPVAPVGPVRSLVIAVAPLAYVMVSVPSPLSVTRVIPTPVAPVAPVGPGRDSRPPVLTQTSPL